MRHSHKMPFGAEVKDDGSVRFRLWAPSARKVELCMEHIGRICFEAKMDESGDGFYELVTREAKPGSLYRFRINGETLVPDPASRFQPEDALGPSLVVDPEAFDWQDGGWKGRPWEEMAFYEIHVGAYTPRGRFISLKERLDHLADLGVTALQIMPVNSFPGKRNWGYDGVLIYAPE
ncbi:MAG TPA: malto-oligosyltrehalose trehalohydrolase, partial [Nitrospirota bacterium]